MLCKHKIICLLIFCIATGIAHADERMTVKSNVANVRAGPNQKDAVLWQVEKYHPVLIIEKKGAWYHFQDFEGDKGWIHSSLLNTVSSVIVKADKCNIREGPGTKFKITFTVDRGIPFKVLQTKGEWIEVQHADGDRGWIYRELTW